MFEQEKQEFKLELKNINKEKVVLINKLLKSDKKFKQEWLKK